MKKLPLLIFLVVHGFAHAQVTFVIQSLPSYTPPEDFIYIAGSFNGWNPGDINYRLSKNDQDKWWITLAAGSQGASIQYKFTRGSWETVEKGPNGEELNNRNFIFGNGDTVNVVIANWNQGGGGSTAADNVIVMDEDFEMPQLGRNRRIWLYLPPDYETSGKDYPVLYMHDGQNLFDASTSFAGEWEVDETLNELFSLGENVPIVIGIDNGGEYRTGEYTPWPHPVYGGGEGVLYTEFIVQTLKPYIDANYRTLPEREFTGIMGSSLGGLVSHYAALEYPEVFSKAGIFSPSYWWSASVWPFTSGAEHPDAMRLYLMCGGSESPGTISNMLNMQDTLFAAGLQAEEVSTKVIPGGQHNENLWRQDFGEAYLWLFGSYAYGFPEQPLARNIRMFPNPAQGKLYLPEDFPDRCDSLEILDMMGRQVVLKSPFSGHELEVSGLPGGIYLLSLRAAGHYYQGKFVKK